MSLCLTRICGRELYPLLFTIRGEEEKKTAHETAEKVREYLLNKIQRHWDKSVTVFSDHLKKQEKPNQSVRLSDLVGQWT